MMNSRIKKVLVDYIKTAIYETKKAIISSEYQKKEKLRGIIQDIIQQKVITREIKTQKDLDLLFQDFDLVMTTLKSIPYEVWEKISVTKK